ncbi:MAG TPA: hypothetical protein VGC30_08960, partial [Dokdonella sp.]
YLTAWGYGLIVADLSDPLHPAETGRLPYAYASAAAASGGFVYLGTATNGGIVQVVDVSDPAHPVERGALGVPTVDRLQVHGTMVYAADELTGLHVVDASDPDAPVQRALYDDGCFGFVAAAYDVALSDDGTRAYVACETGLHVVDVSDPDAPRTLGVYATTFALPARVAVRGDRAWFADPYGLHEIDVSDPTLPVEVATTDLASYVPARLRALDDGRVLAFMAQTGLHVFGEAALVDRVFADGFDG